jgi:Family of unknown function (DUF6624)
MMQERQNELRALFEGDQADRRAVAARQMTQPELNLRDYERRQRLDGLAAEGKIQTADDYYYAAYILQHGTLAEEFRRAHDFAAEALIRGSHPARWLFAATLDRWLVATGQPQQYGTQYVRIGNHGYAMYTVDPEVTDAERAQYDVPPLGEQLRLLTEKNGGWPVPWVQRINGVVQIVEPDDAPDAGPIHLMIPKNPHQH